MRMMVLRNEIEFSDLILILPPGIWLFCFLMNGNIYFIHSFNFIEGIRLNARVIIIYYISAKGRIYLSNTI